MPLTSRGFPLFLTFDLDAETMWTARDPSFSKRPILMSQGAYGWKVGVGRILDLLRRYDLRSTFFIPGVVIEQRLRTIAYISVEECQRVGVHNLEDPVRVPGARAGERQIPTEKHQVRIVSVTGTEDGQMVPAESRQAALHCLKVEQISFR